MSWLSDIRSDIRAGLVSVVSDAEHMARWRRRHWRQAKIDKMAAARLANNYSITQLHALIDSAAFGMSPYRDDVIRQCNMALRLKRCGQAARGAS